MNLFVFLNQSHQRSNEKSNPHTRYVHAVFWRDFFSPVCGAGVACDWLNILICKLCVFVFDFYLANLGFSLMFAIMNSYI